MIIVCPRCGILYGVDSDELAAEARTVRCSNCDREWLHTPAAALPDNDDALRLLAASFGREGHRSVPKPSLATPRAEVAPLARAPRREKAEALPERPWPVSVEPVATPYPAAPATAAPGKEPPSRTARLSSRQLGALLNVEGNTTEADVPSREALKPEPRTDEDGWRPAKPTAAPQEKAAPETAPAVEPARALNAASEDEAVTVPPPPDGAAEVAPSPRRPPLLRRHGAAVLAAGAVLATLFVSVGLLAATRGLVLAAFPGAAGFYSAVGLAPADSFAEGLEIRDVSSTRSWADGEQILTVAGDLANVAEQPCSLPMVRVVLVDGSDAEVQEAVVLPPGETLPVGETVRFEARISNPADTAERIKVSLAPRPEPS